MPPYHWLWQTLVYPSGWGTWPGPLRTTGMWAWFSEGGQGRSVSVHVCCDLRWTRSGRGGFKVSLWNGVSCHIRARMEIWEQIWNLHADRWSKKHLEGQKQAEVGGANLRRSESGAEQRQWKPMLPGTCRLSSSSAAFRGQQSVSWIWAPIYWLESSHQMDLLLNAVSRL